MANCLYAGLEGGLQACCLFGAGPAPICCAAVHTNFVDRLLPVPASRGPRQLSSLPKAQPKATGPAVVPTSAKPPSTRTGKECHDFRGAPLPCDELEKARRFNSRTVPGYFLRSSYGTIRDRMNRAGLLHTAAGRWEVGHACPNEPDTKRSSGVEDKGKNLFAQTHSDNVRHAFAYGRGLGNCQVSCKEAGFYAARHVPCNPACSYGEDCCVHFETCGRALKSEIQAENGACQELGARRRLTQCSFGSESFGAMDEQPMDMGWTLLKMQFLYKLADFGMHAMVAMSCWDQLHQIQSTKSAQALERADEVGGFLRSLDIAQIQRAWSVASSAYDESSTLSSGLDLVGRYPVRWRFSTWLNHTFTGELHCVAAIESSDTRVLHLGFEGTNDAQSWGLDIIGSLMYEDEWGVNGVKVHAGFRAAAAAMWKHVIETYGPLKERYSRVHVTGHSLGGAIAVLVAMKLEDEGVPYHAVTFAQPKVTDVEGGRQYASLDLTRVIFEDDPIPAMPWLLSHFQHALVVYADGSIGVRPSFDTHQSRPVRDAGFLFHKVTEGMCTTHPDLGLMAQCLDSAVGVPFMRGLDSTVDNADECKYMYLHAAASYARGVSMMVDRIYTPAVLEKEAHIDALAEHSVLLHNYTASLGALMQTEFVLQLDEVPLDVSLPRLHLNAFDQQVRRTRIPDPLSRLDSPSR